MTILAALALWATAVLAICFVCYRLARAFTQPRFPAVVAHILEDPLTYLTLGGRRPERGSAREAADMNQVSPPDF